MIPSGSSVTCSCFTCFSKRVDRIKFEVGDACNLRNDLGSFDLVLASNLICRLTEPLKFLNRLKKLVKQSGYAILSTPLTWGTAYTDEVSLDIHAKLNDHFTKDMTFLGKLAGRLL